MSDFLKNRPVTLCVASHKGYLRDVELLKREYPVFDEEWNLGHMTLVNVFDEELTKLSTFTRLLVSRDCVTKTFDTGRIPEDSVTIWTARTLLEAIVKEMAKSGVTEGVDVSKLRFSWGRRTKYVNDAYVHFGDVTFGVHFRNPAEGWDNALPTDQSDVWYTVECDGACHIKRYEMWHWLKHIASDWRDILEDQSKTLLREPQLSAS